MCPSARNSAARRLEFRSASGFGGELERGLPGLRLRFKVAGEQFNERRGFLPLFAYR